MRTVHVCPTPGCPQLAPCPDHTRPTNAQWSTGRDTSTHLKLRRRLIKQRGPRCQRCGWATTSNGKGLQMHHVKPGNTPDAVILLCRDCHKEIDTHAR